MCVFIVGAELFEILAVLDTSVAGMIVALQICRVLYGPGFLFKWFGAICMNTKLHLHRNWLNVS